MKNIKSRKGEPRQHFLITGLPGSGKTTLIIDLIDKIPGEKSGFVTKEVRSEGERMGFDIITVPFGAGSKRVPLAVKSSLLSPGKASNIGSARMGSYTVFLKNVEEVAVPSILKGLDFTIIDEIGKMECISKKFRSAVLGAMDSAGTVVATISKKSTGYDFITGIKRREDVRLFEITRLNRDILLNKILEEMSNGWRKY
ncbi:MAG: AAA family ATPase [Deltaproteobacteria bacterium]|uniref:AAA family ATPase n=1 Tax=Candidatus Zymogenus saltonus TaxID=2844893 RepID=A0A9D8KFF7_9DELT|nr:AAA family ATPase [Candidatus Zymogenus saltonus]